MTGQARPADAGPTRRRVLAGAAAATLACPAIGRAQALEPLSVRVDFSPWGVHAALHLAKQKGWFKDAGLDVAIQDGTGTLSTINLVGAGHSDVGLVQLGPMAIARTTGVPVRAFAGFLRRVDLAIMVDAAKGPRDAKDLAGRKIVCFAASTAAPFIDVYLRRVGLGRGDGARNVNVVMVSPQAMVSTYATGDADGFMSLQEFGEPLVMKTRPARSLLAADVGIAYPSYGFTATDDTIGKRAAALRKLNETQQNAWAYIFADTAHVIEAAQAMIAGRPTSGLDPDVLAAQIRLSGDFFATPATRGKPIGWQATEDWANAVASMTEAGLLKDKAGPESFFTNDLLPG